MAAENLDNRIYYELRWVAGYNTMGELRHCIHQLDNLKDAYDYYQVFVRPFEDKDCWLIGAYRIHQLEKVDLSSYEIVYDK